jgi:hypothetical protein
MKVVCCTDPDGYLVGRWQTGCWEHPDTFSLISRFFSAQLIDGVHHEFPLNSYRKSARRSRLKLGVNLIEHLLYGFHYELNSWSRIAVVGLQ